MTKHSVEHGDRENQARGVGGIDVAKDWHYVQWLDENGRIVAAPGGDGRGGDQTPVCRLGLYEAWEELRGSPTVSPSGGDLRRVTSRPTSVPSRVWEVVFLLLGFHLVK